MTWGCRLLLTTGVWICSMSFLVDSRTPPKSYLKSKPDIDQHSYTVDGHGWKEWSISLGVHALWTTISRWYSILSSIAFLVTCFFSANLPGFPISCKPHSAVSTLKLWKFWKSLFFQNYDDSMGVCPLLGFYTFTVFFGYRAGYIRTFWTFWTFWRWIIFRLAGAYPMSSGWGLVEKHPSPER